MRSGAEDVSEQVVVVKYMIHDVVRRGLLRLNDPSSCSSSGQPLADPSHRHLLYPHHRRTSSVMCFHHRTTVSASPAYIVTLSYQTLTSLRPPAPTAAAPMSTSSSVAPSVHPPPSHPLSAFHVGQRVQVDHSRGPKATIRYIGPLHTHPSTLPFIGLQYDPPTLGKHDGTHAGHTYFHAPPHTGVFVRHERLLPAVVFHEALRRKYEEPAEGVGGVEEEKLSLTAVRERGGRGGRGGRRREFEVEVQFVGVGDIARKIASGLSSMQFAAVIDAQVAEAGDVQAITAKIPSQRSTPTAPSQHTSPPLCLTPLAAWCAGVVDVDLSNNLLVDWAEVAKLVHALPQLRALTLSHNQLQPFPSAPPTLAPSFSNLRALILNAVPSAWSSVLHLASTASLPLLSELHLAHNAISALPCHAMESKESAEPSASCADALLPQAFPALTTLDLSHNRLAEWDVVCALQRLPRLQHLILNGNQLSAVVYPTAASSSSSAPFASLHTLSLSDNSLSSFASLSALSRFPSLTSLSIQRNASLDVLATTPGLLRLHAISRIPSLALLNSSTIQRREQSDAEKFYMAYAEEQWRGGEGAAGVREGGKSVGQAFERYEELRRKHGMGVEEAQGGGGEGVKTEGREGAGAGTLGKSTAEVQLRVYDREGQVLGSGTKRLLLTMKVSALRAVMDRLFKLRPDERSRYSMQGKEEEVSLHYTAMHRLLRPPSVAHVCVSLFLLCVVLVSRVVGK